MLLVALVIVALSVYGSLLLFSFFGKSSHVVQAAPSSAAGDNDFSLDVGAVDTSDLAMAVPVSIVEADAVVAGEIEPADIRHRSVQKDVNVYVLFYRSQGYARRYVRLYGKAAKKHRTGRIVLGNFALTPRVSAEEVMTSSIDEVKNLLSADDDIQSVPVVKKPAKSVANETAQKASPNAAGNVEVNDKKSLRTVRGMLMAHGNAWYAGKDGDSEGGESYFAIVRTGDSEEKLWGVDLKEAIEKSGVKDGQNAIFTKKGKVPVVIKKDGLEKTCFRNRWEVIPL